MTPNDYKVGDLVLSTSISQARGIIISMPEGRVLVSWSKGEKGEKAWTDNYTIEVFRNFESLGAYEIFSTETNVERCSK